MSAPCGQELFECHYVVIIKTRSRILLIFTINVTRKAMYASVCYASMCYASNKTCALCLSKTFIASFFVALHVGMRVRFPHFHLCPVGYFPRCRIYPFFTC